MVTREVSTAGFCAGLFLIGGIFGAMACRASLKRASAFLVTDLTISTGVAYGLGATLNLALAPNLFLLNMTKLVASKVIGYLATLYLQQYMITQNTKAKTEDENPPLSWKQAVVVQYGAVLVLGIFAAQYYRGE